MTRLLHVINTTEVGGGAEHLVQLLRGLGARGFEARVLTGVDGPGSERLRGIGVPVQAIGRMGAGAPLALAGLLRRERPDLLHLHGGRSGLFGALAARALGVRPVVYTPHAFSFSRRLPAATRWLAIRAESFTCGSADRVISLTAGDRETARALGVPTAGFVVVPNGIEIARYPAARDLRAELGLPRDAPVVGMFARLVPQKNPAGFVRMAERVAAARPDARFVLAGDGELRRDVERRVEAAGLRDRLLLPGMRADVPELLATLDVVVFPSLWEGLPLALLEAMAAGRAVVASATGHAEVLEHGVNGLLAPAEDADAFAAHALALLSDPARRAAMGRAARRTIEQGYTVDRMVERTIEVYRAALGERGGAVSR